MRKDQGWPGNVFVKCAVEVSVEPAAARFEVLRGLGVVFGEFDDGWRARGVALAFTYQRFTAVSAKQEFDFAHALRVSY